MSDENVRMAELEERAALLDRVEAIIGATDATVEVKAKAYISEVHQWRALANP